MKKLDVYKVVDAVNGTIFPAEEHQGWVSNCGSYDDYLCDLNEEFPCEINGELWTSAIGFKPHIVLLNLDNDKYDSYGLSEIIEKDCWVARKDLDGNDIEVMTWEQVPEEIQNLLAEHYYNVVFPALFERFYLAFYDAVISGEVDNSYYSDD